MAWTKVPPSKMLNSRGVAEWWTRGNDTLLVIRADDGEFETWILRPGQNSEKLGKKKSKMYAIGLARKHMRKSP